VKRIFCVLALPSVVKGFLNSQSLARLLSGGFVMIGLVGRYAAKHPMAPKQFRKSHLRKFVGCLYAVLVRHVGVKQNGGRPTKSSSAAFYPVGAARSAQITLCITALSSATSIRSDIRLPRRAHDHALACQEGQPKTLAGRGKSSSYRRRLLPN
jgi:hypothetical protein